MLNNTFTILVTKCFSVNSRKILHKQTDDYGRELCVSVQVPLEGPCLCVTETSISVKQGEILGQLWNY